MTVSEAELARLEARYNADGFVKIEALLTAGQLQEIERELARYITETAPDLPAADIVYERDVRVDETRAIRNLWRMEKHSAFFANLAHDPRLVRVMNRLVRGEALVSGVELFGKPAFVGSAVPFHQDNAYFNLVPPDALTCWIAQDDSTLENGCVYYARGSHHGGLRPHRASGVQGNSLTVAEPPATSEVEEVAGVLSAGGAILHNCLLLHRSEPNQSPKSRRGLLIVYRGSHCQMDPAGSIAYQRILAQLA